VNDHSSLVVTVPRRRRYRQPAPRWAREHDLKTITSPEDSSCPRPDPRNPCSARATGGRSGRALCAAVTAHVGTS
jgi:hypothetical protein